MYTDSNLELSIALSLISNILSFGMMPMWLALWPFIYRTSEYGLGLLIMTYYDSYELLLVILESSGGSPPYLELLKTLSLLVGPLILGMTHYDSS